MDNRHINYQFKFLYALGMVFIVAGHTKGGGFSLFYDWFPVIAFHLGLFMFASGYFYRQANENNISGFLWKKVKRLIIPLYMWNVVYGIFCYLTKSFGWLHIGGDLTLRNLLIVPILTGHQFGYNLCAWFLIPLFMVHVYFVITRKTVSKIFGGGNEWIYFIFSCIIGLVGIYIARSGYNRGWFLVLDRFLYFVPFYSAGILYHQKLEQSDNLKNFYYFGFIGLSILAIVCVHGSVPGYVPAWCRDFGKSNIFMPLVVGGLGIAFWLRVSRIMTPAIRESSIINKIADNTWSIMMHQFMGFMLCKAIFYYVSLNTLLFHDFNAVKFKSYIWYYYFPNNRHQFAILYLIAGIVVPLIIHWLVKKLQMKLAVYKWFKWCAYL